MEPVRPPLDSYDETACHAGGAARKASSSEMEPLYLRGGMPREASDEARRCEGLAHPLRAPGFPRRGHPPEGKSGLRVTASATLDTYRGGMDADQARDLYRQVLELRDLLEAVAGEPERLAGTEPDPERRGRLLRRAMRIRARLHAG